jgi:pimeloyl-ACP methyl ester carboxylesterase
VQGVRLSSYEVGSRDSSPVVVVVPGLCVASYLYPACDALAAEGFQVELVEPPGWPRSARPDAEPRTMAQLADWVSEWLTTRGLTDVVLVGQSMGAQIAAHVAERRPDRVAMLVLQGPVFDPKWRTPGRALCRWLLDIPRERPSLAAREAPEWLRVGPRRVWHNLQLSVADRLEDTVARVRAPVVVAVGEHDTLAGRPWAAALASPGGDFLVLRGLPHSAPHSDPSVFARLLRERCERGWP